MVETVTKSPRKRPLAGAAAMGAGPGRPKGLQNKTSRVLKDAILLAAEQVGEDGSGRGELVGYLRRVAQEDVKAFASLLGKVLPLQITGEGGAPVQVIGMTLQEFRQVAAELAGKV